MLRFPLAGRSSVMFLYVSKWGGWWLTFDGSANSGDILTSFVLPIAWGEAGDDVDFCVRGRLLYALITLTRISLCPRNVTSYELRHATIVCFWIYIKMVSNISTAYKIHVLIGGHQLLKNLNRNAIYTYWNNNQQIQKEICYVNLLSNKNRGFFFFF